MNLTVAFNLREKSVKINHYYKLSFIKAKKLAAPFYLSFSLLFLILLVSCTEENQIGELFENWAMVEEKVAQNQSVQSQLEVFLNLFEDFRATPIYKNLIISEKYGSALQDLENTITTGDINQIRIAIFNLEEVDKLITQKSNQEYAFLAEAMIVFSVIISIFLYIIFRNYEKKKNEAKQLGIYSDFMIKGMESERTRISKEIHDSVLQDLKALSLKAEILVNSDNQNSTLKKELLSETAVCIKKLRSICNNLTPVEFKNKNINTNGFIIALQNLTEQFTEHTKTLCILKIQEQLDISSLDRLQSINIFRIIQEALNNAEKHAEATNVSIIITSTDGSEKDNVQNILKIFITDNGKGFDSSLILKENGVNHGHFGLYNMKERAKDIGAAIEIISEEGEGTEIKLEVPLK